jgi:hypothetical protein
MPFEVGWWPHIFVTGPGSIHLSEAMVLVVVGVVVVVVVVVIVTEK